ncbi:hypothetical protein LR032_00170 [Candidatus Bipolaricaulota bacterium]|nr:hypothetical protein [Candidatus Bipolaricaulota bacterium]
MTVDALLAICTGVTDTHGIAQHHYKTAEFADNIQPVSGLSRAMQHLEKKSPEIKCLP